MKYSPFQKSSLHLRPPRARSLSNMDATEEVPETSPEGILRNVFKLSLFAMEETLLFAEAYAA